MFRSVCGMLKRLCPSVVALACTWAAKLTTKCWAHGKAGNGHGKRKQTWKRPLPDQYFVQILVYDQLDACMCAIVSYMVSWCGLFCVL